MSRISCVVACAMFMLAGVVLSNGLVAEQVDDPFGEKTPRHVKASVDASESTEGRIDAQLDETLRSPIEFIDTPLVDVIAFIEDEYKIQIIFDTASLNDLAISPATELSIHLKQVTLRSALDLIFRTENLVDLTHIIDKEVLLITTKDVAEETTLTRVYQVDDFELFNKAPKGATAWACYCPLIGVITSCVETDSWNENGTGEGEIRLVKPGMLVVTQTRSVHRKIVELLTDLRKVRTEIEGG